MDSAFIIGIIAGLIGVGAGIFAIIWGLGFVEYMGGRKKSLIAALSAYDLKNRLLGMNSPDSPYGVQATGENSLVVEWKIVDAKWWGILTKERLSEVYRAYIFLDDLRRSVRYCEETVSVRWLARADGKPTFNYQKNFFRGRILFQKSWSVQYGIKEDLTLGKVYEYKFDVRDVRNPVRKVVESSGWEFVPVVRKSHAT